MARAAKAADKEAEVIIASLSRASEAAVETTLQSIVEKLRANIPLMYHMHALLHNEEWTAVLVASMGTPATKNDEPSGEKPGKVWKLRANLKKLSHLNRQWVPIKGGSKGRAPMIRS